jgi:hypothetical protein
LVVGQIAEISGQAALSLCKNLTGFKNPSGLVIGQIAEVSGQAALPLLFCHTY